MELLQNELMKRSKVLSVVLTIFWVYSAAIGLLFAWEFLGACFIDGDITFAQRAVETGRAVSSEIADMTVAQWRTICLVGICSAALGVAMYYLSTKVFRSIAKTGEPFAAQTVRRLKTVAWLVVACIPWNIASGFLMSAIMPGFTVSLRTSSITGLMQGTMLAVLFFALVSVFQYGAELQRLSDETL